MPFATPLAVAIYFTIWWIVLLTTLPFGVRNAQEDQEDEEQHDGSAAPLGADPGAPVAPKLALKAAWTTVISAVVFGVVVLVAKFMDLE